MAASAATGRASAPLQRPALHRANRGRRRRRTTAAAAGGGAEQPAEGARDDEAPVGKLRRGRSHSPVRREADGGQERQARERVKARTYSPRRQSAGSFDPAAQAAEVAVEAHQQKEQMKTIGLLFSSYCAVYFSRKPLSVVKSAMQDGAGVSTATLGALDTAFLASYAVGQLVLPSLGDRFGTKRILVASLALTGACALAFGQLHAAWAMVLVWSLCGLAQSTAYPLHVSALSPWFPSNRRGMALGVWATSQQAGGVLSTACAALLMGALGWRAALSLPALVTLAAAVALVVWHTERPESAGCRSYGASKRAAPPAGSTAEDGAGASGAQVSMREVLAIPRMKALMASYFCVKIIRYTLVFWLPFFLAKQCGFTTASAGYMSCAFDLGGIAGGLATGFLCDKFFPKRRTELGAIMCAGLAAVTAVYLPLSSMGTVLNLVGMTIIGFLVAGPDALLGSAAVADACEESGYGQDVLSTAGGLVNGAGSVGAVLQGALTAWVAQTYGWGALFACLSLLSVASVGCLLAATPPRQQPSLRIAH
uniref:Major facilitator superfamily (MFS) profile domain-containing protein n=1 Tax=Prasinoderma coloniale TaxID=156133 RepID=A0A7R9TX90_9VIRI|mmetsp:Transcript_7757/g.31553  ORF Transcript_7757/g.31553 Transcript_7757/m.31553 type:complete len:539 (+) Transcript_7757:137-1753(+)|eukprot:PRCOL_00003496-RA